MPTVESCILLSMLKESGQSKMVLGRIPAGTSQTIRGHNVKFKRETVVELEQSKTTGNALVTAVGEAQIENVFGPLDATMQAGAFDVGTKEFEVAGYLTVSHGLVNVHAKGNAKEGMTGFCILFCGPVPKKEKPQEKKTTPQ